MRLTQNAHDPIDLGVSAHNSRDEPRQAHHALALSKTARLGEAGQRRVDHRLGLTKPMPKSFQRHPGTAGVLAVIAAQERQGTPAYALDEIAGHPDVANQLDPLGPLPNLGAHAGRKSQEQRELRGVDSAWPPL